MLTSVGVDGSTVVHDLLQLPEFPIRLRGPGEVRSVAFSPDDRFLAISNRLAPVSIHDLLIQKVRTLDDFPNASEGAACLAFAPESATLAVGQEDGRITLWDPDSGRQRQALEGHTDFVAALAFAPRGSMLASSGGDRLVRIWDLPSGRSRRVFKSQTSTFVAMTFSPDGRLLALGDQVSPVVWLCEPGTVAEPTILGGPEGAVVAVAISPDGATLAAADYEGVVTFWDLATLRAWRKRLKHAGVHSLAFAPGGRMLATAGFDGTIHLWDFPIPSADRRLTPPTALGSALTASFK
jgi:WD40 repeat protein